MWCVGGHFIKRNVSISCMCVNLLEIMGNSSRILSQVEPSEIGSEACSNFLTAIHLAWGFLSRVSDKYCGVSAVNSLVAFS